MVAASMQRPLSLSIICLQRTLELFLKRTTKALAAYLEHGALSDHHRLIRQFGVAPLMYYQYGET